MKTFNKKEFIKFLKVSNVDKALLERVEKLPKLVHKNKTDYKININYDYLDKEEVQQFEINYYSNKLYEFLFPYKIHEDLESSLDNIEKELNDRGIKL